VSIRNLDRMFNPSSVAIIGASEREGSVGSAVVKNILKGGYGGRIFPINPKHPKIFNLDAYPTIQSIGEAVDLAIVATPIITVPNVIRECSQAGAGGAVILSAGGKEIGEKGRELEAFILKEIQGTGLRIIGPNCAGIICSKTKLLATFADNIVLPENIADSIAQGHIAFVSQSGAICVSILDLARKERIGFSHFVTIGDMLDVDFADLIDYLGNDPVVHSIVLYMEGLQKCRRFMTAARAVSSIKPIIALKSGRSRAGARAVTSHTGSLAGSDAAYDAAFERAGMVRVNSIEELFDCAELLSKQPLPKTNRIAIITNGGGPGVMAADALSAYGIEPAPLSRETLDKLNGILPPFWSHNNPIDILGDASAERFRGVVEVCASAPEIDGLMIIYVLQAISDPADIARAVAAISAKKSCPILAVWIGGMAVDGARAILNDAGIPNYENPEKAVEAFIDLFSYGRNLKCLKEVPSEPRYEMQFDHAAARTIVEDAISGGNQLLSEVESKKLLASYGIPVSRTELAKSVDDAVRLAREMEFPVVMKIHSPDITHKSDAGAVRLDIRNEEELEEAYREIMANCNAYNPEARLEGVSIQPMLQRSDYELILGCKKDPDFGPVLLFGMGGIMTEILKDRSLALPPLNRLLARKMIESTRVYQLLKGFRGRPAANLELIEEVLLRLSQLVIDFPEIVELDINPMIVSGDKVLAVDGRVVVEPSDVLSPRHLVISPYPREYERAIETDDGAPVFIRPIRPEDAPLLIEFFSSLSPESLHNRFLWPMKSATPPFLTRMTQVDYDTDMVMVAFQKLNGSEKFLGIARYMGDADEAKAELSVVVGEDVRNKGIGRSLIASCLTAAEDHEIGLVWVVVSSDNTAMLHLGEKMGFTVVETQGSHEFELRIKPDERQTVIKTLPETVPLFPGLQGLEKGSAGGART